MSSGAKPAAEVIVIDSDSEDDDDDSVVVIEPPPQTKNAHPRPKGMDAASWKLIQQIQQTEEGGNLGNTHASSSLRNGKRKAHGENPLDLQLLAQQQGRRFARMKKSRKWSSKSNLDVLLSLKPCQRQALDYVRNKAKQMHQRALPQLQRRVEQLNRTPGVLRQCLEYIRDDAPIIIHVREYIVSLLVKDTHYRNQFEVQGGVLNRIWWYRSSQTGCNSKHSHIQSSRTMGKRHVW